jgi:hypothetical protein
LCAYLILGRIEEEWLALEPVLDGQSNFAKIVAPEHVLVPDNKLEGACGLGKREVDGKFESGVLLRKDGVERGFDIWGLFSFTKKRDDYVAAGSNEQTGRDKRGETHGSLLPLLSMARRSLQLQTWTFRLNAGCSPGWGPTGAATPRDLRIGTTIAALATIALKRTGFLDEEGVVVVVWGGIRTVRSGGVEVSGGCGVASSHSVSGHSHSIRWRVTCCCPPLT